MFGDNNSINISEPAAPLFTQHSPQSSFLSASPTPQALNSSPQALPLSFMNDNDVGNVDSNLDETWALANKAIASMAPNFMQFGTSPRMDGKSQALLVICGVAFEDLETSCANISEIILYTSKLEQHSYNREQLECLKKELLEKIQDLQKKVSILKNLQNQCAGDLNSSQRTKIFQEIKIAQGELNTILQQWSFYFQNFWGCPKQTNDLADDIETSRLSALFQQHCCVLNQEKNQSTLDNNQSIAFSLNEFKKKIQQIKLEYLNIKNNAFLITIQNCSGEFSNDVKNLLYKYARKIHDDLKSVEKLARLFCKLFEIQAQAMKLSEDVLLWSKSLEIFQSLSFEQYLNQPNEYTLPQQNCLQNMFDQQSFFRQLQNIMIA